ncbi:hypothetical protein GCM10027268_22290 [Brachybacterium huguangmaarense]
MNRDDVLDAQAALSELYNACSPPSHSDMDVAFARAKVESPRATPTRDVNKRDRVRVAFEYALDVPGHHVGASRVIGGWPPRAEWRRPVL